jgi:ribonuclease HII
VAILNGWHIDGIKDSKDIRRENVRRALAAEIRHNTVWQVGMIHADRLEEIGPYKALKLLQHAVISNLAQRLSTSFPRATITAVLDGAGDTETHPTYSLKCVPKADSLIYEVSAASILAKATRDDWVHEQVKSDPGLARYKLDDNKGYGTPAHTQALQTWGLTPHHRAKACRGQMKGTRHEHSTPLCG